MTEVKDIAANLALGILDTLETQTDVAKERIAEWRGKIEAESLNLFSASSKIRAKAKRQLARYQAIVIDIAATSAINAAAKTRRMTNQTLVDLVGAAFTAITKLG